jgi:sodium-dependent dicarboxylate transporter 2/3/5
MTAPRSTTVARVTDVAIDRRPLWRILLGATRRPLLILLGVVIYTYTAFMPTPAGLTLEGQRALAVFLLCLLFWVLNVLPLMITSLLAIVLLPLSGALPSSQTYSLFGNEAIFFILGAFILAAALMRCGLSTRIALVILRRFGHTPRTLLISIFLLNAVMSCFMSEHAVAAMTFPIITEIVTVLRLPRRTSNYGRALFLAMAWGTTIGGVTTLLGGGRAPLAIGILREATGETYGFAEWTLATWPVVAIVLVAGYQVIVRFFPIDITSVREADAAIAERALRLGRPSTQEKAIGAVMAATLLAWITLGEEYGLANIALAGVVVLFALGLTRWRDLEEYVNWGILLMYGGAICLGAALNKSGAAAWLAEATLSRWGGTGTAVVLLLSGLTMLLTEAMSNSAVVALLMPVTIGVATSVGIDPRLMAPVVAIPAGLAFMLPIGTPANAIAYSSGYLTIRDMFVPGTVLLLVAWVAFNAVAFWYWPLVGLSLNR